MLFDLTFDNRTITIIGAFDGVSFTVNFPP